MGADVQLPRSSLETAYRIVAGLKRRPDYTRQSFGTTTTLCHHRSSTASQKACFDGVSPPLGRGLSPLVSVVSQQPSRCEGQATKARLYERYDFDGEVGASLSVASKGSRWLIPWDLDTDAMKPVLLRKLIMREWETGEIMKEYGLGDYKARFGTDYYNPPHRHGSAAEEDHSTTEGAGTPAEIVVNHRATDIDSATGTIIFDNGAIAKADLVVAADGTCSRMRQAIGATPKFEGSTSCCCRCIISASKFHELGISEFVTNSAIQCWGGFGINKIVMYACNSGDVISCYCFYSAAHNGLDKDGWNIGATGQELVDTFPGLDERVKLLFINAEDIKM